MAPLTRGRRRVLIALAVLAGLALALRLAIPLLSGQPGHIDHAQPDLRLHNAHPNQVSSLAEGERHVEPLPLPARGFAAAVDAVAALPRTRVVHRDETYAHLTARSLIWGFIDDVQLQLRPDGSAIDIKSSARLGLSDLGVNRARVERIRAALAAEAGDGDR